MNLALQNKRALVPVVAAALVPPLLGVSRAKAPTSR